MAILGTGLSLLFLRIFGAGMGYWLLVLVVVELRGAGVEPRGWKLKRFCRILVCNLPTKQHSLPIGVGESHRDNSLDGPNLTSPAVDRE